MCFGMQWHQLGHMQNLHLAPAASTTQFLHARCHSCRPTNSAKALKANAMQYKYNVIIIKHNRNTYAETLTGRKKAWPTEHNSKNMVKNYYKLGLQNNCKLVAAKRSRC